MKMCLFVCIGACVSVCVNFEILYSLLFQAMNKSEKEKATPRTELNLPRGRCDSGSSYTRTLSARDTDSLLKDRGVSTARTHHRRSSSLSRVSSKSSSKMADKGVSSRYGDTSGSLTDRSRTRTKSNQDDDDAEKMSFHTTDFSKTYATGTSDIDKLWAKPKSPASSPSNKPVAPKIKPNLMPVGSASVKPRMGATIGARTSGDYGAGAFTRKSYTSRHNTSDDDDEFGLHSLPANFTAPSNHEDFLRPSSKHIEICAICLDQVKRPTELKCKHKFCTACLHQHFTKSKPSCPTCGSLYGKINGDQPQSGKMTYVVDRSKHLAGYESADGIIVITYSFPDGVQEVSLNKTVNWYNYVSSIVGRCIVFAPRDLCPSIHHKFMPTLEGLVLVFPFVVCFSPC